MSHNAKAVYQKYLGWYDANPAHLNPLPQVESAQRSLRYMGGADAVLVRAREDFAKGDYRWVAEVVMQVVYAEPGNTAARGLAADALEPLGYQAESGVWRNAYLSGAGASATQRRAAICATAASIKRCSARWPWRASTLR